MIIVALAFLLFAALVQFFQLTVVVAAVVTGVIFGALGLLVGERFPTRRP